MAEQSFSLDLERPIDLPVNSLISIRDGFATSYVPLITNKQIETTGVSSSANNETVTLSGDGSDITNYSSLKHLFYVNEAWLDAVYANYKLLDGVIHAYDPGATPYQVEGVSISRLFINHLPDRSLKDSQFECIVQTWTHRSIASHLAAQIGYTIDADTPDLALQKVFHLPADQPYFQAIAALFAKWNPFITIEGTVIKIRDYGGSIQTLPSGSQKFTLTERSFEVVNWTKSEHADIVDHIIIEGPSKTFTYKLTESLSTVRKKQAAVELSGTETTLVYEDKYDEDYTALLEYSPNIEQLLTEYSDPSKYAISRTVRTLIQKTDFLGEKTVTVKETIVEYDKQDNISRRTIIKYDFADYDSPLGHTMAEWNRRPVLQGGYNNVTQGDILNKDPSSWELVLDNIRKVVFGDFIGDTGQVEADVITWQRVQYMLDEEVVDGTTYQILSDCKPTFWHDQIGVPAFEEDSDYESAMVLWQTERIRFDVVSPRLMRKNRLVTQYYPMLARRTYTEDIPIKRNQKTRNTVERKWEYFWKNGNIIYRQDGDSLPEGNFHPVLRMSEPDVVYESTARDIAYRQFRKRGETTTGGTIKLVTTIPGLKIGHILVIPDCTKKFLDWDTDSWENVTIDGGTFWATGHTRTCRYGGDTRSNQRELDAHDKLEIKQYY